MESNTTETTTRRHLLYTYPDGRQFVFDVGVRGGVCRRKVHLCAPLVLDEWWLDEDVLDDGDVPDDLLRIGREISREEALRITGYYVKGRRAVEHALITLERVPETDELYLVAQAAGAMLAGLTPDVMTLRHDNIFQARIEAAQES